MQKVLLYFQKADPIIYDLLIKFGVHPPTKSTDLFLDLCETIISQQLSTKAADTIFSRLKAMVTKTFTYEGLLKLDAEQMRKCGISYAKIKYIQNIATETSRGNLKIEELDKLSDEDVKDRLIKIKGIGHWTSEMLLMFSFGREDVFSYGDAGLRRAIKNLYGFKKEPTVNQMKKITDKWKPYRTYASRILWKSL